MLRRSIALALALAPALGLATASAGADPAPGRVASRAEAVDPLAVGARVPAVTVADVDGEPVALDAAIRSKQVALIFYRGGW